MASPCDLFLWRTALNSSSRMMKLSRAKNLTRTALGGAALAAAIFGWSCQEYDAPPDVRLVSHTDGGYSVGEPLRLSFTEAIDPDSLSVRVWPATRGTLRIPLAEVEPASDNCNYAASPCTPVELEVEGDGMP